jgi:hypothetical protein
MACPMTAADRIIRWTTAGAVVGVAAVAAVASYEHAYALVRAHGESGWTGRLIPLTVDGLIYASSTVLLDSARRHVRVPALARWLLGLGIVATLAANVAHGLGHGIVGAAVAAWSAVALVGSYELLMMIIRGTQTPAAAPRPHDGASAIDPLGEQAAAVRAIPCCAPCWPAARSAAARVPCRSHRNAWKPGRMSGDGCTFGLRPRLIFIQNGPFRCRNRPPGPSIVPPRLTDQAARRNGHASATCIKKFRLRRAPAACFCLRTECW